MTVAGWQLGAGREKSSSGGWKEVGLLCLNKFQPTPGMLASPGHSRYTGEVQPTLCIVPVISVVDPKLFFPDPDPTLTLISDPDPASL